MTTGNVPVRSAYGRAGFKPRHRLTPLSPPTACACLAALWRADRPAQLPPYRVAVRAPNLCRAWLNLSRPPRTEPRGEEPREPRHRPTRLSPFTACAAPPAQSPPYGVDLRAPNLCRAGFQPRHKPTRLSPFTACAAPPAQSPPYGVGLRALCRGPLVPGSGHEPGSRCAVYASRWDSRDAISARYRDTNHSSLVTAPAQAKKRLIATHPS